MSQSTDGSASNSKVIMLSAIAALGGFLFGFDSGVINGTVDALQLAFDSDAVGTGFNVASMLLGCAAGAFFAGSLADKFGRKPMLISTAIAFIISAWGSGAAGSSASFVVFRILGGLAVGGASVLAPAYISEIAPPKIRGRLTSLQQLMIVIGLLGAFLSNYVIADLAGGSTETLWAGFGAYQWMFWVEIIPAAIFLMALFAIPESPRYLVAAGMYDKAKDILSELTNPEKASEMIEEIKVTVFRKRKPRLSDVIMEKTGRVHPIVWVGIALAILQQFTGINVVFYYGSVLWQAAGFTEGDALFTNVINGTVNIAFTLLAIYLIDKVGRKPLLKIGALGQAVTLGAMAFIFTTGDLSAAGELQLNETQGVWALLAANAYIAFFATTWGPIMWVMLGEMFPNKFRGAALAICGLLHWLSNFAITLTFPILLTNIGLGLSYGIYAGFGFVAYFVVKNYVDETMGKSLEEMSQEQDEIEEEIATA
ncbi:MAG: sugar porter family MFS transporter [Bacteroidota bacterium]